jgi:hypothetical protein
MIVVLLGYLCLAVDVTLNVPFSGYEVGDALQLPANSPHSASDLVRMTRDDHPGVLVEAHRRTISFSARGSLDDADRAVNLANRAVIAANDGKVKARVSGSAVPTPLGIDVLFGVLAGLSAALGFLVPPRSRVTAPH